MRVVLVSSPGRSPGPHWSQVAAAEIARELLAAGADVELFDVAASATSALPPLPGARVHCHVLPQAITLHGVAASLQHVALERDLAHSLRRDHAAVVLHLGVGAGGSPNVLWLAERMGSDVVAVVRTAELVCHRGDLVDATGNACQRHDDAATCRTCCTRSWWHQPRGLDFENRWDLLLGGLLAAEAVFVRDPAERDLLLGTGIGRGEIVVDHGAPAIARRVLELG
jgi:hypothetical protein